MKERRSLSSAERFLAGHGYPHMDPSGQWGVYLDRPLAGPYYHLGMFTSAIDAVLFRIAKKLSS